MQSNFCKVPKGCLWVKHANEDQSKVFSKIPGLSRTCWYDQSSTFFLKSVEDWCYVWSKRRDSNSSIRILLKDFFGQNLWSRLIWWEPRKKSIDKIHSKSQTKPTISNLSSISPCFFSLILLAFPWWWVGRQLCGEFFKLAKN